MGATPAIVSSLNSASPGVETKSAPSVLPGVEKKGAPCRIIVAEQKIIFRSSALLSSRSLQAESFGCFKRVNQRQILFKHCSCAQFDIIDKEIGLNSSEINPPLCAFVECILMDVLKPY